MTFVFLNSKFRQTGTFDNFTCQISPPQHFNKVKLLEASIPQTMYVINNTNNTFNFTFGVTFPVTVPPGNYDPTSLISTLNSLLGVTASFSTITGKITFTETGTLPFSVNFNVNNSIYSVLGFQKQSYTSYVSGSNSFIVGDYPINLSPPTHLMLNINGLGLPSMKVSSLQPCVGHWPIMSNGVSYTYSNWSSNSNFDLTFFTAINNSNILEVSLLNSDGTPAGINCDWACTLLFI